ncbi:hypothetical protein BN2476_1380020 [Paraburkholderia piptadeniae]|uniref:Uncharacterized protein n=1 Tax=Paraburkholderia piptadeniae TaxID=1701573 RepID=A0A1N7SW98_9BURK|nr:hypothetical protein BN2476_1380020 [Paraburkholderia piptadeniae]
MPDHVDIGHRALYDSARWDGRAQRRTTTVRGVAAHLFYLEHSQAFFSGIRLDDWQRTPVF